MDAQGLRTAFTRFFAERGHTVVPSASLIPHDPTVLFTIAGMVPFKPYFLGEETSPWPRATTVQKCFRTPDIDLVGTNTRHLTFFEMLGNFSFGDYFKELAIPYAWDLVTEVFGIEPDRLWVTVHETDDEAKEIWTDAVGVPAERVQWVPGENFWSMGDTGPCGPSSELFFDKGDALGAPGGPAHGGEERYVEIWNLVFMQYNRLADGSLVDLPRKNIDTGAGFERVLSVLQGTDSVFATDELAGLVEAAERATGARYGETEPADVALRVMADHARAMTMLVADGVLPSNTGRGYVLRRVLRRAVLAARRLGTEAPVLGQMAGAVAELMGEAYPSLTENLGLVVEVVEREESGFDRTLRSGLGLLEDALGVAKEGSGTLGGDVAFWLHDTHGFPIELTEELATEADVAVDRAGFEAAMAEQRERARQSGRFPAQADEAAYRALLDDEGPSAFVGRSPEHYATGASVLAVLDGAEPGTVEIFLDRTPFYAEGGGQVGDTGAIATETGRAEVFDTQAVLPGLTAHRARLPAGDMIFAGQDATAAIDGPRREALRRNHTGTHLLHAALREVLGDHVRQQGSRVMPDRLSFDFSHHGQPAREELSEVIELANADMLSDAAVETTETTLAEAQAMGAIAFFEEKYGDTVRVVRAGPHSLEFCGGTHVGSLGQIGPLAIVSESSIGANTRRIEALTGLATIERSARHEALLADAAGLLRTEPEGVVDALERLLERQKVADKELARLRAANLDAEAVRLADGAADGVVVARRDGLEPDALRSLAVAVRRRDGTRAVVLGGSPDGAKVSLAVATDGDPDATALVRQVAEVVGGGGGGSAEVALAGGREVGRLDEALDEARRLLGRS
ncbi:MAG TPA: alanine--tRNA ligase [Acidimicrobiales bacterium]|nr:alanine--tRNA ligase [Acidimicrobiales bacterium]